MLLGELLRKFPLPSMPQQPPQQQQVVKERAVSNPPLANIKTEPVEVQPEITIKQEFSERSIANGNPPSNENSNSGMSGGPDVKDIKVENISEMKPPPEKRMKQ